MTGQAGIIGHLDLVIGHSTYGGTAIPLRAHQGSVLPPSIKSVLPVM